MTSNLEGLREPISGIPKVRVLDKDGKQLLTGWYVFHEARQRYPIYQNGPDELSDDELQHLVVVDESADWGMPKGIRVVKVTHPERIEVIE